MSFNVERLAHMSDAIFKSEHLGVIDYIVESIHVECIGTCITAAKDVPIIVLEATCSMILEMSNLVEKPTMWFPTRYDTNRAVQAQKMAGDGKVWIWKVEELYFPCSENKGADKLRGYREADLRLCFAYADCWFSHEAAQ